MKILHINCNYIGTKLHQTMTEHLEKIGVINCVYVPCCKKDVPSFEVNNYVVTSCCFRYWDRLFYHLKQYKIIQNIITNINIKEYDIIHAYTLFSDGNVAMNIKRKYRTPYIVTIRNTDVNVFFKYMIHLRHLGVRIMDEASAIVFLSKAYKDQVYNKYVPHELLQSFEKKTYIIPNGIDDFWFENINSHKENNVGNCRRIVYVGKINKNKNIETAIKAVEMLNNRQVACQYSVVGEVEDQEVFNQIKECSHVSYLGKMDKNGLLRLYRKNDVFLMPSYTETFGLVYAEAMSQGLPVIYTRGQGFDNQFPDGYVGYSVDCKSPDEIADKICSVLEQYSTLTKNCITSVNKFCWDTICKEYKKIYDRILSGVHEEDGYV